LDVVSVLAAYLLGAVPFSQLVSLWRRGVDLRTVGTGTVSGTGLYQVAGLWPLVLGGGLDVAKGAVAATFARGDARLGVMVAAAVVTGHCWSVFLRGAGGRGVSTAMGVLAVLAWPGAALLLAALALGRLVDQTGVAVLIADLLMVAVLAATGGAAAAVVVALRDGVAVVAPMLIKRLLGNSAPEVGDARTYAWRLLCDADPPRPAAVDAAVLTNVVRLLAARLDRYRDELNRLNVYPVPDGDTGDNLEATVGTVVGGLPEPDDRAAVCDAIARGALLGGRGSSGVILGQALRGFVATLPDPCGPDGLASALEAAATWAHAAVADPAEGTILTVARDAARQARAAVGPSATLADVVREAAAEGRRSLARTPDLLPALARAGVVDAGGLGYVLFLDALAEAVAGLQGGPIELAASVTATAAGGEAAGPPERGGAFEVLCLLEADDDHIEHLREQWLSLGDTVAIAGGDRTWRCHVHTDDVVAALQAARDAGDVSDVEITDLTGQVVEEAGLRGGRPQDGRPALVAVAEGDGLVAGYLEAGADRVVIGGISTKPSTGELLRVIDGCQRPVVLLAGDKDVVPAAEHAGELAAVPVRVVRAEMLGGLMALESAGSQPCDDQRWPSRLDDLARSTTAVRVQRAVRDTSTELGEVHAGAWLATSQHGLVAIGATAQQALLGAVAAIVTPACTAGLLALDLEAPADVDVATALRRAHPHLRWRVLRANRQASAYGVAVR
jgi:DAK2 domain fusion protein YloV